LFYQRRESFSYFLEIEGIFQLCPRKYFTHTDKGIGGCCVALCMSVGSLHKLCDGSSIDYIVQPVKHKKYPPLRRIFVICVYFYFVFFLFLRLLYFSSNSLPSSSLSIVNGCLQCMHASTRPNILVGFSQLGQIIGTARVDNIPIHK